MSAIALSLSLVACGDNLEPLDDEEVEPIGAPGEETGTIN